MSTEYDKIARAYQQSKTLVFRECIEWYSYRRLLGDVSGLKILDLACGEGFYSRRVKLLGAAKVLGVDVSAKMIDLARQQENALPLDIEYVVADAGQQKIFGVFDMVIASYLLNYARSRQELLAFCRTIAANLKPSARGELEITDVNLAYLRRGQLKVELLGQGFAWLDTGTHEAMQQAASYVQAIQERQGLKIACIEEIAYRLGYINGADVKRLAMDMTKNDYGRYLMSIIDE